MDPMTEPASVHLTANLPLKWQARDSFPPEEVADWMHGNVVVLQALANLESAAKEGDAEHHVDHHVARLEAKIDLTLTLVGELLRHQVPLPPAVPVALTSEGIAWQTAESIPAHAKGLVSVYLSRRLPWPLMLPVEVVASQNGQVRARLMHMSEEAQEWLDRTLFRHHRRAVHARTR
jgi:hypothetical protein